MIFAKKAMNNHKQRVALVTDSERPQLSLSDRLLVGPLDARGVQAVAASWDEADIDWTAYDAVVLRSCWNYIRHVEAFRSWIDSLDQAQVPLWNAPQIVRWNMDKRYLRDLAKHGIPIPPTLWLDHGESASLAELLDAQGWTNAVVKPRIGASAHGIWQTSSLEAQQHQQRLDATLLEGGVMIQELVEEIRTGEWSLVFFRGRFSHAVLKRPGAGSIFVQGHFGGSSIAAVPPNHLIRQAEYVLRVVEQTLFPGTTLLYARVDGIEVDQEFVLMELELTEPGLFLDLDDSGGATRFADAIMAIGKRNI